MKASSRTAMALAVGYMLGRRRKLRLAAVLAGVAASDRAASLGGAAIKRSMGLAGSSSMLGKLAPHFGGISNTVRDELVSAGKAAAVAVVSNRIESLSDSLHQRTESIRGLGDGTQGGNGRRPSAREESGDEPMDEDYEEEPEDSYEEEPEDSYEDEDEDEDEVEYDDRDTEDSFDDEVEDDGQVNGSRQTRRSSSSASR